MKQSEAEQVYLNHQNRTEEIIHSMGDNSQEANAFITNSYFTLYQNEPTLTRKQQLCVLSLKN